MDNSRLQKFFQNACSPSERKEILQWLLDPKNDFVVRSWMKEHWDEINGLDVISSLDNTEVEQLWMSIQKVIGVELELENQSLTPILSKTPKPHLKIWQQLKTIGIAASLIFVIGIAYFIYQPKKLNNNTSAEITTNGKSFYHNDINAPKNNTSILVLEGGTKIYLDNVRAGLIATQGNVNITKNKFGEIAYQGLNTNHLIYNTITVPKGSKIQKVLLSDGSAIFLNAGTSFTFPIAFIGNERRVTINGEGYFEIAKNKSKPFYVNHNDVHVKVLGTHFNVNAYSGESNEVKVTLLEGSVEIIKGKQQRLLKPGQTLTLNDSKVDLNDGVDTSKTTAWKNEQFYFDGDDIHTIMSQVEKVYNVNVVYNDAINYSFVAKLSRNESLSTILQVLELTNVVHFKIEGNKVIVSK